jgi:hypothetical protein
MDQPLVENRNLFADDNAMLNAAGCLIAKKPRQMQESKEIKDQEMKV